MITSRAWLNLSRAALLWALCSSQASSSNAFPDAKLWASFVWQMSAAWTSLPRFFPTVHSHFSMPLLFGFQPASSGSEVMIMEPEVESQNVPPFCASSDSELDFGAKRVDSSTAAPVSCVLLQMPAAVSLLIAASSLSLQPLFLGGLLPSQVSSTNVFPARSALACLQ